MKKYLWNRFANWATQPMNQPSFWYLDPHSSAQKAWPQRRP